MITDCIEKKYKVTSVLANFASLSIRISYSKDDIKEGILNNIYDSKINGTDYAKLMNIKYDKKCKYIVVTQSIINCIITKHAHDELQQFIKYSDMFNNIGIDKIIINTPKG